MPNFRPAAYRLSPGFGPLVERYLRRNFNGKNTRVLFAYMPNKVSWSQAYPFFHYASEFKSQHGVQIRGVPLQAGPISGLFSKADIILLQPWFALNPDVLIQLSEYLVQNNPDAVVNVVDPNAPNDLRLARYMPEGLRLYGKKSLFHDRNQYMRLWRGDTNLTEYYSELYNIPAEPVDFTPPATLLDKLQPLPGFFTDVRLMSAFRKDQPPAYSGRGLDMQTRLGRRGSAWYQHMRDASLAAAKNINGLILSPDGSVSYDAYMAEMSDARLCFSPFGYGELCWRDVEAFAAGSVLIKPDMGHLETQPNLYEAGVTYLPVAWDFSNLEHVVRDALANNEKCNAIAQTAYSRVKAYLDTNSFVDHVQPFITV